MKYFIKKVFFFLIYAFLLFSCGSDDNGNIMSNMPPESFELIGVTNGAIEVDILPTFRWTAATDPDNDDITYDLILDIQENPTLVVAQDLSSTQFTSIERLDVLQTYFWKVIAIDSQGNQTESSTFSFTTRNLEFPTTSVINNAAFSARRGHTSVVFDNKIWVVGGTDESRTLLNDVWYSDDGLNWMMTTANAPFTPRSGHKAVVFDNKIWVIGGFTESGYTNDVWFSSDGVNWSLATNDAAFSPRSNHTSVVFDNKLWVIGGAGPLFENEVWYSNDGVNWVLATDEPGFNDRYRSSSVVFDDKIWLISGSSSTYHPDVWYSSDGANWNLATEEADFLGREWHSAVVYNNKIWVIAGRGGTDGVPSVIETKNDIWSSRDGVVWDRVQENAPFDKRIMHSTVIFNQKIWVIGGGGNGGVFYNDVWSSN